MHKGREAPKTKGPRVGALIFLSAALLVAGAPVAERMPADTRPGDLPADIGSRTDTVELGYGWSRPERKRPRRFRWIKRLEADVWFTLAAPVEMDLWVRAAPLYLDYRRQNVGVYINDRFITEWVCPDSPDYADYHAVIPAAALKEGRNRLLLRMGYKAGMGRDRRELSLAVDKILFRPRGS